MKNLMSAKEYREMQGKRKKSKYRAEKVVYFENGEKKVKDSKKEYRRYLYLQYRQKIGEISNLREQVPFLLQEKSVVNGKVAERAIKIVIDFAYDEAGKAIVEDVKSKITAKNPAYVMKRKMFKILYPEYEFREWI